jgi:hypothetical protein
MVSDYASALGGFLGKAVNNSEQFCIFILLKKKKKKMDVLVMDTFKIL